MSMNISEQKIQWVFASACRGGYLKYGGRDPKLAITTYHFVDRVVDADIFDNQAVGWVNAMFRGKWMEVKVTTTVSLVEGSQND